MPDPSLNQRLRSLLKRLTTEVAGRAGAEKSLDERLKKLSARAELQHDDESAAAETDFKKQTSALEADFRKQIETLRAAADAKVSAARARMETHLRNYTGRTNALGKVANQEHEEIGRAHV